MQEVIDVQYPNAEKIILVMDNLATHSPAAFYHAFPPAEARRLASKLEIHHTPLHGSWLNMAEIECAALARQCLSRRIATKKELEHQVACWQEQRNAAATTVTWRFSTADARISGAEAPSDRDGFCIATALPGLHLALQFLLCSNATGKALAC